MGTTMQMPIATTSKVFGRLGTIYTPDGTGLITNVIPEDVPGLQSFGATIQNVLGSGTAGLVGEGPINRQVSAAGVQPGATAADNVIAVYSLPAASFDVVNRGIDILAAGTFGSTANNKRVKIIVNSATAVIGSTIGTGGTTIADTAVVATNGGGWVLRARVYKYGVAGSNTQLGVNVLNAAGATTPVLIAPTAITATESGAILIAVTGNATTAASDILFNLMQIDAID